MKKTLSSIALMLLVLAALFSLTSAAEKDSSAQKLYELKYQMKKGTTFVMVSSGTTETVTNQMGTEVVADIQSEGTDTYVVLSSDKEKGLTIEVEMGERTQDISSDMGSASADFSALVGKKAKFVLLPDGEAEGFEGFDVLPEVTTASGEVLTKDLYILGVKGSFPKLPDKPVKFGDTWNDTQGEDVPLGGGTLRADNETTYTLVEEVEKDGLTCLRIEFTDKSTLTGDFEQQGTLLNLERETTTTGNMYFALEKGMFILYETEAKAEGIIFVPSAGIDIPQTINTKGSVTIRFE
ncbi:MAG: hypothetical protein ACERK6_02840 [Candidatus Aminicenantaceae bacterium]